MDLCKLEAICVFFKSICLEHAGITVPRHVAACAVHSRRRNCSHASAPAWLALWVFVLVLHTQNSGGQQKQFEKNTDTTCNAAATRRWIVCHVQRRQWWNLCAHGSIQQHIHATAALAAACKCATTGQRLSCRCVQKQHGKPDPVSLRSTTFMWWWSAALFSVWST